jgi:D-alanine-D-alanine ligase
MKKLRVGVIYGGRSGEHEVSVASAASIFKHLDRSRFEPIPIRIEKDGRWTLADKVPTAISAADVIEHVRLESARSIRPGREAHLVAHPGEDTVLSIERQALSSDIDATGAATVRGVGLDVVFPVLHGPYGEDGTVQGLLELAGLPYVGAGVLGSAVAMDKIMMKRAFAAAGLPSARYLEFRDGHDLDAFVDRVERELGLPCFVKPSNMGSSVGVSKASSSESLRAAVLRALDYDEWILVEEFVPGREIEVAVLGDDPPEASVPGEIVPGAEFYDYADKYEDGTAQLLVPAPLSPEEVAEAQALAVRVFEACRCEAMARVDCFLRDDGTFVVNELNTIPGFTPISMYPKLWEASGLPYSALLDRLIDLAVLRHERRARRAGKQR